MIISENEYKAGASIFLSVFEISVSVSLVVATLILFASFLNKRYAAKWKYLI